jgi:DNA-binding Lrp family transcriptional regulator
VSEQLRFPSYGGALARNVTEWEEKRASSEGNTQEKCAAVALEATPLDRIDRNILRVLQEDAAITNAALSERVHLSRGGDPPARREAARGGRSSGAPSPCSTRRRLDMTTLVIVGVVLDRSTPSDFGAFETAAKGIPGLPRVPPRGGRVRLLPRPAGRATSPHFNRLHAASIISLPGVRQIRTFFVLKEILSTTALPV